MPTTNENKNNSVFEDVSKENVSTKKEKDYRKFLEEHHFTEMNFPFSSFLRKANLIPMPEAGAL
jgi:hypothetical protein